MIFQNENINVVKSTKSGSLERLAQKPSGKTTPLGKTRMLQMPSSVTKNTYTTPSNSQYQNPVRLQKRYSVLKNIRLNNVYKFYAFSTQNL